MNGPETPNSTKISAERRAKVEKVARRDLRIEHILRRALHHIERLIAAISIIVLVVSLAMEIYKMITISGYFSDIDTYLHNVLNIVVGLEFIRMLIDTTPASILEVLTVAITRHVILSHDDPLSNVASIACIAGLFAIRRFLVRRHELKQELVDVE